MRNEFKKFQVVTHKNGKDYIINREPDGRRLECCNEQFYEYQEYSGDQIWIRRKSEMEDGRFIK